MNPEQTPAQPSAEVREIAEKMRREPNPWAYAIGCIISDNRYVSDGELPARVRQVLAALDLALKGGA